MTKLKRDNIRASLKAKGFSENNKKDHGSVDSRSVEF